MELCVNILILASFFSVVQLKVTINGTYTTPFQCTDGNYALIEGSEVTLKYDYGYSKGQIRSFHLFEARSGRHMFDYESITGRVLINDEERLKEGYWNWTDTGIWFTITGLRKTEDAGKYRGDLEVGSYFDDTIVEIKKGEIKDPPPEVHLTSPSEVQQKVFLQKEFGEYVLNASAHSYNEINCSSVMITWVSPTEGDIKSCQAEDPTDPIVCPLVLKESNMTEGCMTLEVFAQLYGVQSNKTAYTVCYELEGKLEDANNVTTCQLNTSEKAEKCIELEVASKQYGAERDKAVYKSCCDDANNVTTCQLNTSEKAEKCIELEVASKQYGAERDKAVYKSCCDAGLDPGPTTGIVFGCLAALVVIVLAIVIIWWRRRNDKKQRLKDKEIPLADQAANV